MIQFDFDWSDPFNLIIFALATALLPMLLWLIFWGRKTGFTPRIWVKTILNVLLWLALIAFIVQPYSTNEVKTITGFFTGRDVPATTASGLRDSITTIKSTVSSDFRDSAFDTLVLAGQDFKPAVFEKIARLQPLPNAVEWIPYFAQNQLQALHWKGMVRKGEMQVMRGRVMSSKSQALKVTYGGATLDSLMLKPGLNLFKLQFTAFSEGRTAVELVMGGQVKDTIRFFARPLEKLTFQFILDSPDFESRALANWLGKSGHSVIYDATLSKDIKSQQKINKVKDPDVIITDADNVGDRLVKKSLALGKSVLLINLTDPSAQIRAINAALGTKLNVRRIATEESVKVQSGLTALPFRFVPDSRYLSIKNYPVAVQKMRGKVGVSLLNETFPLQLTGDSIAYQQVWDAVLANLKPVAAQNAEVEAPLFKDISAKLTLNGFSSTPNFLRLGSDTLFTNPSSINATSATIRFKPLESGWLAFNDALNAELYIENEQEAGTLYKTAKMMDFIKSYQALQKQIGNEITTSKTELKGAKKEMSDWMWFALLIICFLAVWIERKL